ncbi:DUF58 domain-containing protein [Tessaracoccus sp. OH4464_COT-324]|uniref:DUF58 domain-containing protein n=1 Tax=Tessaracoccus sp. OH4464_COT-324 TaxID=2491059 RepID=UPI000F63256C|nr:DUF58 domain-containing protein [Tessaracoccus sp. OH4464_COT-324]RRD45233.1 DUF58 domain-containing protein [Tessaracoccus sp. OH4464_COT-324]
MPLITRFHTQVSLALRRPTSGFFDGGHQSVHIGRSLDFNDLREYVRGDDPSDIDWKASARRGGLLVKRHVAERRATLLLAVATGRDMAGMASLLEAKSELAVAVAATLASLAVIRGDYVGLVRCNGAQARLERPATRLVAAERMLGLIQADCAPSSPPADVAKLLEATAASVRRRAIVAVICDDIDLDAPVLAGLKRLSAQHDVLLVSIGDLDPTAPELAGRTILGLDDDRLLPAAFLRDARLAQELRQERAARQERRSQHLARLRISHLTVRDSATVVPDVLDLVRRHGRGA